MQRRSSVFACLAFGLGVLTSGCKSASTASPASASSATSASVAVAKTNVGIDPGKAGAGTPLTPRPGNEIAVFAQGCFWGSENTFRHVPGVVATAVGYTGGKTDAPTYKEVCKHTTGHAEAVVIEYDPKKVSYAKLLGVFFRSHDPTTMNRQGPDVGDQYRSAIFTLNDAQREEAKLAAAEASKKIGKPVVTQIAPLPRFWMAEEYHQQYDEKTGTESCPLPSVLNAD